MLYCIPHYMVHILVTVEYYSEKFMRSKCGCIVCTQSFATWLPLIKKFLLGSQEMLETLLFLEVREKMCRVIKVIAHLCARVCVCVALCLSVHDLIDASPCFVAGVLFHFLVACVFLHDCAVGI